MKIKRENLTEKQKKTIGFVCIVAVVLFLSLVSWFVGRPMVRFFSEPEKFRVWVSDKGFFGKIAFIVMIAFQVVVAFIPGEPLEIGAGYAFGAVEGTILCMLGITAGSLIVFLLVKKFGIRLVEVFFSPRKSIRSNFCETKRAEIYWFL